MRTLLWIGVGWLGITCVSALGSRLGWAHLMPDVSVWILVFLAMRRQATTVVASALALGYAVDRQAVAPLGLHETALALGALGVYGASGHLMGRGCLFFCVASAGMVVCHHAVAFGLVYGRDGTAGFSSWATASLLPSAVVTGGLARLCYPGMLKLDRWLNQETRKGLTWG